MGKYFLAIVLPEPAQAAFESIKQSLYQQYGLKGALRSPAHITLHMPFEWPEHKLDKLIAAFEAFEHPQPFEIEISDFGFFEPRVVFGNVILTENLEKLQKNVVFIAKTKCGLLNEAENRRGFHPHVTVAFRDLKKPLFYTLKKEFESKQLAFQFQYTGFSLMKLEDKWVEFRKFGGIGTLK